MKFLGRNVSRTCLSILLVVVCLVTSLFFLEASANRNVDRIGTLTGDGVNFREGPSKNYKSIKKLAKGTTGEVLEISNNWYKMNISGTVGWVSATYVDVNITGYEYDAAFEEYMNQQRFPESYRGALRELHAVYPNWIFKAQHIQYSWSEVIAAESRLKVNLVAASSDNSWKSMQEGAYDWSTGTWIGFDGDDWVAASTEIIQHYIDPRNFLDEIYLFQFIEQSYNVSSMTEAELNQIRTGMGLIANNTYLAGACDNSTYIDVIMNVAAQTGVNPYTIAAMLIQEQGVNGTGGTISGKNSKYPGIYNHFNIGAYPKDGMDSVTRGLWYASQSGSYGRPWDTKTKSILGGATHYGEGFVNIGQDTLYLKKFDVADSNPYTHQYMTNIQGAANEGKLMSGAYNTEARKASLVFKIPVYAGMPSVACPKPAGNVSANNMLQSLSVSGCNLTPSFSMYNTSYSAIVSYETPSVTVSALAYDSNAIVSGGGNISLNVGYNTVSIQVQAANGNTNTYTITILRDVQGNPNLLASVSSENYTINNDSGKVTGIKVFPVSADGFIRNLTVNQGKVMITKADGTQKTGNVGTGDKMKLYNLAGEVKADYEIIIYGDTNGDGKINALDLLRIQKDILGISKLSGVYSTAADTNKNGKTNALDLLQVQKQILKIGTIQQ